MDDNNSNLEIIPEQKYNIFIRIMSGKTITILVNSFDLIEKIKSIIEEKEDIPTERQKLIFGRKNLENNQTLGSYNIQKDNTLNLYINYNQNLLFNISIQLYSNFCIDLEVGIMNTIEEIKKMIEEKEGMTKFYYELYYDGKLLENNYTIGDYNIHSASIIDVVCKEQKYNIFIKNISRTITIMVSSYDLIEKIKSVIEEKENIPVENQKLIFGHKNLENNRTLKSYNIQKDDTINLFIKYDQSMVFNIFVKTLFGKIIELKVRSIDTVKQIKNMIEEKEGILESKQELYYAGKFLKENLTVEDYNIQIESTVYLIIKNSKK